MTEFFPQLNGHVVACVYNPDGTLANRTEADNVVCTPAYTALASAVNWAGTQDVASSTGLAGSYLTPIYGAVGLSAIPATSNDAQLGSEYARITVSSAGASGSSWAWLFQFSSPGQNLTIQEAGVFVSYTANGVPQNIASGAANTGVLFDHVIFSGVSWGASQSLTLQFTFTW